MADTREIRQSVLRPYLTIGQLAEHEPADAFAVGAFDGDALIAVGLVGREGGPGSWRVRGMATVDEARGRGAGAAVLAALIEHAVSQGATRIWCEARVRALSLYERAGFSRASEEFEREKIGPHYVMAMDVGR